MIITKRHRGFSWCYHGNTNVKGCFFDRSGAFHRGEAMANYFSMATDADSFRERLREANGCFAVFVETSSYVMAAVDRVRSIPLFYAEKDGELVLSDDIRAIQDVLGGPEEMDPIAREEFLRVGYTVGPTTLDVRIKQIEAGEMLVYHKAENRIQIECYFRHSHGDYTDKSEDVLVEELDGITSRWARRLIDSVQGRTILIPLSGGYDSRMIVCALKREGYDNVICYSYGVPASYEHQTARQVAERLGYPIHMIDYSGEQWPVVLDSPEFLKFCRFISQRCASTHFQEYLACHTLRENAAVPKDSVIVPGFCGDLQGGSYVPEEVLAGRDNFVLAEGIDNYILRKLFRFRSSPIEKNIKRAILDRINAYTCHFATDNIQDFCSVLEDWFTRHKVAKFVVNSLRNYEWYGYEWRLPLWDNELIKWWYQIPLKHRVNSKLYHRFLFESLFDPMAVAFKKPLSLSRYRLMGMRWLPISIVPSLNRFGKKLVASVGRGPVDINAGKDRTAFLIERFPLDCPIDDIKDRNGIMAMWCLAYDC